MVFARKNCDFPWLCQFTGVSETSSSLWAPNFRDILRVRQWSFSIYIYIYIYNRWDSRPTRRNFPRKIPKKTSQMPVADFMLKSRFTSQLANFWSRPLEASIPSSTKKRHSGHIWPFLGESFLPTYLIYLSPKRCVSRCSRTWGVFSSGWPLPRIDHLRCTSLRVRPTARFTWWTTTPRSVAPVHPHQPNGPCKNLKIWQRYNGPYWECLWYHEMVRMVKTSRKLVKTSRKLVGFKFLCDAFWIVQKKIWGESTLGMERNLAWKSCQKRSSGLERLGVLQFVYRHVVIFRPGDQGFVSSERCNFQVCVPQTLPSWGTGRISQVICWLRVVDQNSFCKSEIVVGRCFFFEESGYDLDFWLWDDFVLFNNQGKKQRWKNSTQKNHRHRFPEKVQWKDHPNILFPKPYPPKINNISPKKGDHLKRNFHLPSIKFLRG